MLFLDTDAEGMGVDLAVRAIEAEHSVRYWLPREKGEKLPYGDGMVEKPDEFEPSMEWADLIVVIGNSDHQRKLTKYYDEGYPILGTRKKAAEWELDRGVGQEVLDSVGIETLPFTVVDSVDEAIAHIVDTDMPYVLKPWGGEADKAMTYVAKTPDDAIFTLQKWEREGLFKGQLMMQEKTDGIEMGIAGWFGPNGWLSAIEESFEHKKFMNDDLGCNTGEQGTVLRHVKESKLFDLLLAPLTDKLAALKFVGNCSVNCIITDDGTPMPLEFTMRFGWPATCICMEVFPTDPCPWMLDLVNGRDSLKVSPDIALGVVLSHGDFPQCLDPPGIWSGYPLTGISSENYSHIHFQQVQDGKAPVLKSGKVKDVAMTLTAGTYVLVAGGSGKTVQEASEAAYNVAWDIEWPGNRMFRTDIGKRLEDELPKLQRHGFALGMEY